MLQIFGADFILQVHAGFLTQGTFRVALSASFRCNTEVVSCCCLVTMRVLLLNFCMVRHGFLYVMKLLGSKAVTETDVKSMAMTKITFGRLMS